MPGPEEEVAEAAEAEADLAEAEADSAEAAGVDSAEDITGRADLEVRTTDRIAEDSMVDFSVLAVTTEEAVLVALWLF